jgi:hypothetical protein
MKKFSVLLVLALGLWVNETNAQKVCTGEEVLSSFICDHHTDQDGAPGIIFLYDGKMSAVTSVHIQTGSCVYVFDDVRMKHDGKGRKAVFISATGFVVGEGSVYYQGAPVLGATVVCEPPSPKASR